MKEKHQDYRRNILRKYETRPITSPIIKTFTAEAKVVNAKFILLVTFVLYGDPLRNAAKKDSDRSIAFCPHHKFGRGTGPGFFFAAILQKAVIHAETMQDQYTELFSCDRCPTDFSVMAENDEAVVKIWYDLGNGLSVEDPCWQSHFWSEEDALLQGMPFNYEHGSISKMYDSCYS